MRVDLKYKVICIMYGINMLGTCYIALSNMCKLV